MTFDLEKMKSPIGIAMGKMLIERDTEIERLRAEMENYGDDYVCQMKSKDARIKELEAENINLETLNEGLLENGNDLRSRAQKAEARIQELEAALVEADQCRRSLLDQVMKVANQRDKLADALTGERYKDTLLSFAAGSNWSTPEKAEETRKKAWDLTREQLQAEGKIGPEDAKPHCWQITEERIRAIQWAEEMAGDCKAGDVLRAMLDEAEQ